MLNRIFSIDDGKAAKSQAYGYIDAIHYMSPHTLAGVGNLCPNASAGCMALCLGEHSGQAGIVKYDTDMNAARLSRRAKAIRFMKDRNAYMNDIAESIAAASCKAQKMGFAIAVRLNGSTDIAFEGVKVDLLPKTASKISRIMGVDCSPGLYRSLFALFPSIQFMDYTKSVKRCAKPLPVNYHLTFSRSETNESEGLAMVKAGLVSMAVVFETMPETWQGLRVIDGDKHDLRHLDDKGCIVGLVPKGRKAKRDSTGFVVRESV
jgi:hypothetical protein